MADKAISELVAAPSVTPDSLFVLQQDGTAKKLTAQVLENWLVSFADGHGGIQSIVKNSTSGLVDTYRITLADTTTFDFMVTNGKGINSVSKVSTSVLVDTYRIAFNDGTSSTFTVTNGEKGDKGDRADIWVKYASQKPTASSHSFGDVPDSWIGIATGHNMDTAPTDWQQYQWYQWKGEKGDPGEPATLVSSQITYQVGDSGTIIPSGSWSESIPPVSQGKYLWTREITQFNTGNPITKYSVSRFGIDGSGSVSTVAGVSPDADGNVPLTAADVKALPIGGGTMEGPVNMDGQSLSGLNAPTKDDEAATKGYVDTNKVDKSRVVNNFTTTEEGFVADARALKALNDSKLSMELLWENPSPDSEMSAETAIDFPSGYDLYMINATMQYRRLCPAIFFLYGKNIVLVGAWGDDGKIMHRSLDATSTGFKLNNGYYAGNIKNDVMIPYEIYGFKGVIK